MCMVTEYIKYMPLELNQEIHLMGTSLGANLI